MSINKNSKKPTIDFNYEKASEYRNYHIDGLFGGVLPTGNIWFDVFVEKGITPNRIRSELDINTGTLTDFEKIPQTDNQILRELQCGFTLNLSTAKTIRDWLNDKIKIIETTK